MSSLMIVNTTYTLMTPNFTSPSPTPPAACSASPPRCLRALHRRPARERPPLLPHTRQATSSGLLPLCQPHLHYSSLSGQNFWSHFWLLSSSHTPNLIPSINSFPYRLFLQNVPRAGLFLTTCPAIALEGAAIIPRPNERTVVTAPALDVFDAFIHSQHSSQRAPAKKTRQVTWLPVSLS